MFIVMAFISSNGAALRVMHGCECVSGYSVSTSTWNLKPSTTEGVKSKYI
jgi:hypothetical protein